MKIRKLLEAGKYDVHKSNMKTWFDECIRKYFPEFKNKVGSDWEYPTFEIKTDKNRAGWHKCSFSRSSGKAINPTIGLNPDFLNHTARNITFHETIHYVQANTYGYTKFANAANGGHDAYFIQMMNKINASEGPNYITVKQEMEALDNKETNKSFWVYGVMTSDKEFGFAYTSKPNDKVKQFLINAKNSKRYKKIYEFQSNLFKYKVGSITKTSYNFGIPNNQPTEAELEKYEIS